MHKVDACVKFQNAQLLSATIKSLITQQLTIK